MNDMRPEDILFGYLKDIIYEDDAGTLDIDSLPENLKDLGRGLIQLSIWVSETKNFAGELANGNLEIEPPGRENPIVGNLKALQATMNHIAWQAGQVTKGDYTQRIDFMGDLSVAFNEMIEQLKIKTRELEKSRDKAIQSRDEYREYAFIDDMTGLHNRHYIMPLLEQYIEKNYQFCISFIDLDQLKQANDLFGHSEGDRYIKEAAQIIEDLPIEKETARVGGDEFLVIARYINEEKLSSLLENARSRLMSQHHEKDSYVRSFSYGVIQVDPENDRSRSDILTEADRKMYIYKVENKPSFLK